MGPEGVVFGHDFGVLDDPPQLVHDRLVNVSLLPVEKPMSLEKCLGTLYMLYEILYCILALLPHTEPGKRHFKLRKALQLRKPNHSVQSYARHDLTPAAGCLVWQRSIEIISSIGYKDRRYKYCRNALCWTLIRNFNVFY